MKKLTALLAATAFIASTSLVAAVYVPGQSGIGNINNIQLVEEKMGKDKKKDDKKKSDKKKDEKKDKK